MIQLLIQTSSFFEFVNLDTGELIKIDRNDYPTPGLAHEQASHYCAEENAMRHHLS